MQLKNHLQTITSQLEALVAQLSDEQYRQPLQVLYGSSVGDHVRHIVEMFDELKKGYITGLVNYDSRLRNKELETQTALALKCLGLLPASLFMEDKPLQLAVVYTGEKGMVTQTTYYREVVYNIEHMVHHMALIRTGMQAFGNILIPEDFGIAASTQKYRSVCAP
jgi:uncharacterized damage-inducible protein DinB